MISLTINFLQEIKKNRHYKIIATSFLLITGILGIISGRPPSADLSKTYNVSGKITQTFSYCGGAAPPKELLKQLATPVAYAGKKFYIRKAKTNSIKAKIVKSFTSGTDGRFSFSLPPGIYSIILEEQLDKIKASDFTKEHQHADEKCLQAWWAKPYYILQIEDKNIVELNFNFHQRCFVSGDIPCITYKGPLPP